MTCKTLFLTLLLSTLAVPIWAQQAITASGGDFAGSDGSVAYSVGQVFYQSLSGTAGDLNEGVQQPYESLSVSIFEPRKNEIEISIFPNPTLGRLNIALKERIGDDLRYRITDFQGQLWEENNLKSLNPRIELHRLPAAAYVLQIRQGNHHIESFKIIKN